MRGSLRRRGSLRTISAASTRTGGGPDPAAGFTLPLVILAALMITAGGLALAYRSSYGLLGSVFHVYGLQAREAAEIGVNRIIAELNKTQNRGVLRSRGTGTETGLWSSGDLATLYRSNCPGSGTPDLASNANLGYPAGSSSPTAYNQVFIRPDGTISASSAGATRSYRLVSATRRPESELTIFQEMTPPAGEVTLVVEGRSLRPDGSLASVIQLSQTFQVVPKCCATSFGGVHGNVNYERIASMQYRTVCLNEDNMLGLGVLGGTGSTTGSLNLQGSNSVTNENGVPIADVYCLADANGSCNASASSNTGVTVRLINPRPSDFPAAKTYPGSSTSNAGLLNKPAPNKTQSNEFVYCLRDQTALVGDTDPTITGGKKCRSWAVNSDAATNKLPNYCTRTDTSANGAELHCKLSNLDYKSTDVVFLTNTRRLRLYFTEPSSNANDLVIEGGTGNNAIYHCKTVNQAGLPNSIACATPPASIKDLALFGCNSCGNQYAELKGTPDALQLFAYFPNGTFTLAGTPTFYGVLWTNWIQSSGNVNWIVPSAGLRDVMQYMGFIPQEGIHMTRNPILFDYVARATNRFRWIGQ